MVFLELRRDSRVTTENSGFLLCWPRIFAGSIKNKKQNPKKQKREKREGELVGMRGDWFMTLDEVRGGHSGEIKNSMGFHWKLSMNK